MRKIFIFFTFKKKRDGPRQGGGPRQGVAQGRVPFPILKIREGVRANFEFLIFMLNFEF